FEGGWRLLDPHGAAVPMTPQPTPLPDDPLANAVWLGPRFDAGFTPNLAGSYTLETDDARLSLPVVATPVGSGTTATPEAGTAVSVGQVPLWRWLVGLAIALLVLELMVSLSKLQPVVRRRWRAPVIVSALGIAALVLA